MITSENVNILETANPSLASGQPQHTLAVDKLLTELRSGRRLERVAASIESFLLGQVSKLNQSLDKCQQALDQHDVVRRIAADFESEKQRWEADRQAEIERLVVAGENLMNGWRELERERHQHQQERALAAGLSACSRSGAALSTVNR